MAINVLARTVVIFTFIIGVGAACCGALTWQGETSSSLFSGKPLTQFSHAQAGVATPAQVQNANVNPSDAQETPVLIEMFLSQSCSSCVPAAAYVRELAARDDVVVLSWHVDYWDRLNVPGHGRWKDPYSSASYTARQRTYARSVFRSARVYTPQAIIDGSIDVVGSQKSTIDQAIRTTANEYNQTKAKPSLQVAKTVGGITLSASHLDTEHRVALATFHRSAKTSILGGENAGILWNEANIVSAFRIIGHLSQNDNQLEIPMSALKQDETMGCALILQTVSGQAISARYCPS